MNRIAMHGWTPLLVLTMVLSAGAQVTDLDPTDQAGAQFGHSVANAGDVNGDGYGDVLVGAMDYQNSLGVTTGGAFLFFGSENGVSETYDWSSTGDNVAGSEFGSIVAPAGDVNNRTHLSECCSHSSAQMGASPSYYSDPTAEIE